MSQPSPASSYPFDARPLVDPVDRKVAADYVKQLRASGRATGGGSIGAGIVVSCVVAVFGAAVIGFISFVMITMMTASGSSASARPQIILVVVIAAVVIGGVLLTLVGKRARNVRWYRMDRFATANGMRWFPRSADPPLPGMIFSLGRARKATDVVRGDKPRFVEFGNYQYTTGSGKNQTTHKWGYVAVHLSSPLPHIVLDALSNNGLFGSNLPVRFNSDQRLSLEGDFNKYFSLFCPEGYERDALYLFTPDIMARFIDNAAALDVEIVDDWMFLYAKRDFSTLDPNVWAWLFSVVGAFLDKFAQWERWRDERLNSTQQWIGSVAGPQQPAPAGGTHAPVASDAGIPFAAPAASLRPPKGVAQQGRRLQSRTPWVAVIIVAVGVAVWIIFNIFGVLSSFQ